MKQKTTIEVTPEISESLKVIKKMYGVSSKEKVIEHLMNSQNILKKEKINDLSQTRETEKKSIKQQEEVERHIKNVRKMSIVPEILDSKKIKFYDENDIEVQIAKPSPSKYFYPFKKPYIIIDKFANKTTRPEDIRNIIEIDELKKMGFCIYSIKVSRRFRKGQQVAYKLKKINDILYNAKALNHIPTNHKIQEDINNKLIRICGKNAGRNGFGEWLNIRDGSFGGYTKKVESNHNSVLRRLSEPNSQNISIDNLKAEMFGIGIISPSRRYKKVIIEDIPIMITQSQEVLCIPNTSEVKHIGVTGMTGTCKSIIMNALLCWNYWQKLKGVCIN